MENAPCSLPPPGKCALDQSLGMGAAVLKKEKNLYYYIIRGVMYQYSKSLFHFLFYPQCIVLSIQHTGGSIMYQ